MFHDMDEENSQSFTYVERIEIDNANLKGLVVNNEDEAYNLYTDYGHRIVQDDQWKVTRFISEHNHELATPLKRHLLKSAQSVSVAKANVINSMVSVGIHPTDVYSYMSNEVCGTKNVEFTKQDCYNYINKHMILIEAGDDQSLLNISRLKSRIDYDFFEDIVVFDTTYCTNRNNLICAPFVVFLAINGNQSAKTIMTDQDHAISKAIGEVFPDSCHNYVYGTFLEMPLHI
ncbi:hypothetical protein Goshw_024222, partial [Gossypium schwendimanii]|nr:hypothetical protein [Gossypium schwendimanii]